MRGGGVPALLPRAVLQFERLEQATNNFSSRAAKRWAVWEIMFHMFNSCIARSTGR